MPIFVKAHSRKGRPVKGYERTLSGRISRVKRAMEIALRVRGRGSNTYARLDNLHRTLNTQQKKTVKLAEAAGARARRIQKYRLEILARREK